MVKKLYTPERGDVVWIDLSPQRGHEQKGRRPVVVLTKQSYNAATGLALVCPVSSQKKGYLGEVEIMIDAVSGVVLVDQIRSVDWRERPIKSAGKVSENTMILVRHRIVEFLFK